MVLMNSVAILLLCSAIIPCFRFCAGESYPQEFLGLVVVMRVVCRKVKYRMLVTKYLHMKVQFNRFSRVWYIWLKYETCALATLIYHFLKTYL